LTIFDLENTLIVLNHTKACLPPIISNLPINQKSSTEDWEH